MPDGCDLSAGNFRPTNYGSGDTFPAPAPAGPYGAALSVFDGVDPNGAWRLFVVDDAGADSGRIAGWSLRITTTGENFPSPAPGEPYGTSLSVFNNTNPAGTWSLYVVDDDEYYPDGSGGIGSGCSTAPAIRGRRCSSTSAATGRSRFRSPGC